MKLASAPIDVSPPRVALPWGRWGLRVTAALYLGVMIALPLAAIIANGLRDGLRAFWSDLASPAAFAALKLTILMAIIVTLINAVMGTLTAYVIVRYRFYGRGLLNGLIDMPFAIPTLVTGVMLVALYGPSSVLGTILGQYGIGVVYRQPGIVLALLFVTLPFVVRLVEPALREMDREPEHAAATLGASPRTIFFSVTLPAIRPAVSAGALLSFARAIGEFGAIVIIAGNLPHKTQTAAIYVLGEIESENQRGASAMSVAMLATAFALTALVDRVQGEPRGRAR